MRDSIPQITAQLLDLFQGPLRDVRFPDADGERLSAAIDDVEAAKEALARAQALVEAARSSLAEKEQIVMHETERTLAYARVYAVDRPDLRATLDALTAHPPSRRGRPRKVRTPAPEATQAAE
jgi:hypothetical protein